jgi:hypothetical protein
MPLPMIHLSIAQHMSATAPHCASPDFLLGSIAPDAIHTRPGSSRADKDVTHLTPPGERFCDEAAIVALVRQYKASDFALGYAAHLLADNLWMPAIIDPWRAQVSVTEGSPTERELYYQDTDQIDFNIYRAAAWRPAVWDALAQAEAPDLAPLLSAGEIDAWRSRTLHWFEDSSKEPGIAPQHITDAMAQDFIQAASEQIAAWLQQWGD